MELREMIIEEENEQGVFAISLVTSPATEQKFIALSEDNKPIKLAKINEDEQLLLGLVLQPNQKIYRNDDEGEYEIFFSEATIKKASQLYLQKGHQHNVTLEHEEPIEGVTMVESWIVADSKKDKSNVYGYEYPVGSWMAVLKVHDKKEWDNIKEKSTLSGFSLEGLFKPTAPVKMSLIDMIAEVKGLK